MNLALRAKRVIASLWSEVHKPPAASGWKRRVILTYHSIGDFCHALPLKKFRAQMEFLARRARLVTLDDILNPLTRNDDLLCAITFDDGYESVYTDALPELIRLDVPATVYVTTNAIGRSVPKRSDDFPGLYGGQTMLTWTQLRMLAGRVTVGSHLLDHLNLLRLSREMAMRQLQLSKLVVEQNIGQTCRHLAYPWGYHNASAIELVTAAGFQTAATTKHSPLPVDYDVYKIPRIVIQCSYEMDDFRAIVAGDWDFLGIIQSARLNGAKSWLRLREKPKPAFFVERN